MNVNSSSSFVPKQALRKVALVGASALAMVLVAGPAKADNLVTDGNFTSNAGVDKQLSYNTSLTYWNVTSPGNTYAYAFLYTTPGTAGATTADQAGTTGQFGSSKNVELWGSQNGGHNAITAPPGGGNFIAADAALENATITQEITGLTVGKTYALTFDWAAAQQYNYYGSTTEYWQVSLGGQTEDTSTIALASQSFSGWDSVTLYFTATSTTELLSFVAEGGPSESQPPFDLLANVSLSSTTPEPGTLTLLLTGGMAGLGALSRRRLMLKARKAAK